MNQGSIELVFGKGITRSYMPSFLVKKFKKKNNFSKG